MDASSIPAKFPIPWANSAGSSYVRNIPEASQIGIQNGAASLTDGFPPNTFLPEGAGGVPPFGQDMNGILKQVSAWCQWQGAGAPVFYDGTFSANIGGYPAGALLLSGAYPGLLWQNQADNNTSNPDSSGSNWNAIGGGSATLASAGTVSLASVAANVVNITGTTPITAFGAAPDGIEKTVRFAGSLTLTYNATSLIVPGAANITTQAGDTMVAVSLGGGNWFVASYSPANGGSVIPVLPTGARQDFLLATAPSGWLEMKGLTIGSASSNATQRANADTLPLFTAMWNLDPSVAPIFTSSGSSSTRGASAAADFAANKQITVPDARGTFARALDDSRGIDPGRLLGSQQADEFESHVHGVNDPKHAHTSDFPSSNTDLLGGSGPTANYGSATGHTTSSSATGITIAATGGSETRPVNLAYLTCIKL